MTLVDRWFSTPRSGGSGQTFLMAVGSSLGNRLSAVGHGEGWLVECRLQVQGFRLAASQAVH